LALSPLFLIDKQNRRTLELSTAQNGAGAHAHKHLAGCGPDDWQFGFPQWRVKRV